MSFFIGLFFYLIIGGLLMKRGFGKLTWEEDDTTLIIMAVSAILWPVILVMEDKSSDQGGK